jgi:hypothetical protein
VEKLIIHAGSQKTGTTSIQSFLHESRTALQGIGFTYAETCFGDPNITSHYNSIRGFFSKSPEEMDHTAKFVEKVNSSSGTVIISAESLFSFPAKHIFEDNTGYWIRKKMMLEEIRSAFQTRDFEIIFFLRDKQRFLVSLFRQYLRVVQRPSPTLAAALDAFLNSEGHLENYETQIRIWREVFGNVTIVDYDDAARMGGSSIEAFCNAAGIKGIPITDRRENASPDWASLEERRLLQFFGAKANPGIFKDARRELLNLEIEKEVNARIAAHLNDPEPYFSEFTPYEWRSAKGDVEEVVN